MNSRSILKKIENRKKDLEKFNVKRIGLFGSAIKNKQKKKSDIDFLVKFEKEEFDNYVELLFYLEKLFKKKIDLVIERNLRPELNYVKKEAKYVKI